MILHSQPYISEKEKEVVFDVLESKLLSTGRYIQELERQLSHYLFKKHAIFTGNGSQALVLILLGMGIGTGCEVIIPSYVCYKLYKSIVITGAKAKVVDVGENWVLEPEKITNAITKRTKAVILPHVYGINAWSSEFNNFGIPIIEDICQSFGSIDDLSRTGTYSDYAFTSFHGTKPLGAGEGGMLFTNNSRVLNEIQKIKLNNPLFVSGNEIVGAIALSQFANYSQALSKRLEIAKYYNNNIPNHLNYRMRSIKRTMYFRYLLQSQKSFDLILSEFKKEEINVRKGVDELVHEKCGMDERKFRNSKELYSTTISIPILPQLSVQEINKIVNVINKFCEMNVL